MPKSKAEINVGYRSSDSVISAGDGFYHEMGQMCLGPKVRERFGKHS